MRNIAVIDVPSEKRESGQNRHYTERCSGTLLQSVEPKGPKLLMTAWHCIEHYADLSKTIGVRFPHAADKARSYSARVYRSGTSISSDWALLKLTAPVGDPKLTGLPLAAPWENEKATALGFAGALEQGRSTLSFDPRCVWSTSNLWASCQSSKGSSGGPLVQVRSNQAYLVGVISQGDSEKLTLSWSPSELPISLRAGLRFHEAP